MFFLAFWAMGSAMILVGGYGLMLLGWRPNYSRPIWVDAAIWPVVIAGQLIELLVVLVAVVKWAGNGAWEILWDAIRWCRGR